MSTSRAAPLNVPKVRVTPSGVLNVRVTPSGVLNVRVTPSGVISRFEDRFNSPGNTRRERFSRLKPQLWAFLAAKAATLNGIHF